MARKIAFRLEDHGEIKRISLYDVTGAPFILEITECADDVVQDVKDTLRSWCSDAELVEFPADEVNKGGPGSGIPGHTTVYRGMLYLGCRAVYALQSKTKEDKR